MPHDLERPGFSDARRSRRSVRGLGLPAQSPGPDKSFDKEQDITDHTPRYVSGRAKPRNGINSEHNKESATGRHKKASSQINRNHPRSRRPWRPIAPTFLSQRHIVDIGTRLPPVLFPPSAPLYNMHMHTGPPTRDLPRHRTHHTARITHHAITKGEGRGDTVVHSSEAIIVVK